MVKQSPNKTRIIATDQMERKIWIRKKIHHRFLWVQKYQKVENRMRALDCCNIDAQVITIRRK